LVIFLIIYVVGVWLDSLTSVQPKAGY